MSNATVCSTRPTLLIIDDCPEDREIYCEYLSSDPQYSYEFLEAPLAEVGLDIFQRQQCDAILLDFRMPDMNGLEFLDELQNYQVGACPPVIMLTGQGSEDLAARGMRQGIQDYLVKQNLRPEILQLAVRNVIQQSNVRAQLSKTRDRQRLISTTALRIRQSLNLEEILYAVVSEIQQLLECDHVAVYQVYSPDASANLGPEMGNRLDAPPSAVRLNEPFQGKPLQSEYFQGEQSQSIKVRAELGTRLSIPRIEPFAVKGAMPNANAVSAEAVVATDITTTDIVAPICVSSPSQDLAQDLVTSYTWGYLVIHQAAKKTPWSSEEHDIVNALTVQLAIAIQQAELLAQTQSALQKANELNVFKSQIVTTVSHEYRTPLATILAAASTLERHHDQLPDDKRLRFLNMIQMKARHMTNLVDDMLAVHQLELDSSQFQPSPINMLPFLADIIESHREKEQNHEFRFSISGRISSLWGDAGMLRIAIDNLLSNAVKFSPDGGIIDVSVSGDAESITLTVHDNGIGIPAEDQAMIFQSFGRASNVETVPGPGIGLSIVKACVDLHKGSISLQSEEAQGTQISITIPDNRPTLHS